ncbi:uncharacterized protein LOC134790404 [Cydia splendana]|uniref:uncharacterized protein LOC134790404 n=1 Tax=Cydia splendana TaxID=1100963 RepID=UPI00300CD5BB
MRKRVLTSDSIYPDNIWDLYYFNTHPRKPRRVKRRLFNASAKVVSHTTRTPTHPTERRTFYDFAKWYKTSIAATDKHTIARLWSAVVVESLQRALPVAVAAPAAAMSPLARSLLARSLLALAALLATAHAVDECITVQVGQKTNVPIPINPAKVPEPEGVVTISNGCEPGHVIGETIRVCSHVQGCVPTIDIDKGQYSPVKVGCKCPGGCVLDGIQYC